MVSNSFRAFDIMLFCQNGKNCLIQAVASLHGFIHHNIYLTNMNKIVVSESCRVVKEQSAYGGGSTLASKSLFIITDHSWAFCLWSLPDMRLQRETGGVFAQHMCRWCLCKVTATLCFERCLGVFKPCSLASKIVAKHPSTWSKSVCRESLWSYPCVPPHGSS